MKKAKRLLLIILLVSDLSLVSFFSSAQNDIHTPMLQPEWTREYKPFRIVGNLYYVGTYDLACYLITTSKGNILINTALAESVPMIKSNIEKLGFNFADIKILLATHAHFDHVAGMAQIKKMTGAKMMINEKDAQILADGGISDYVFGGKEKTFEPVAANRILHDHDTVKLGEMQIVVLHHPGHTKGANSFLFDVKDEHRSYRVLIANMPTILSATKLSGMPTYPDVGKDYGRTFDSLKILKFDIWLSSHASQFALHEKHKPGDPYKPEVFVDQKGYDEMIDNLQKDYLKRLNSQ